MLDFQKSSFQLSMKESSSIRVTTGGKDSLEAEAPSALPSTAQPAVVLEAEGLCVSAAGPGPWGHITRRKQEWRHLQTSDHLLDSPLGFSSGLLMPPGIEDMARPQQSWATTQFLECVYDKK